MATTIYYLTGTGNSLWIARTLARELGGAEVISMAGSQENPVETQTLELVFPVHIWGVPSRVLGFVEGLKGSRPDYLFAAAVNAGQVANTLVQLKKVLSRNGLRLSAGFEIPLPSNYTPLGRTRAQRETEYPVRIRRAEDVQNSRNNKRERERPN